MNWMVFFIVLLIIPVAVACGLAGGWLAGFIIDRFGKGAYYLTGAVMLVGLAGYMGWATR